MKKDLKPKSQKLLDEFSDAAQQWGYQQDQGNGNAVKVSEEEFNRTKEELAAYIASLERKVLRLKKNANKAYGSFTGGPQTIVP